MFESIKELYQLGCYTKDDLALFVSVGWITQDQANELEK